jgi:hypothetical protein
MRYAWSALLLVAAILSPGIATTITLLIAGIVTIGLAVSRELRLQVIVADLQDSLPFAKRPNTTALERNLMRTQRHLLLVVVAAELLIFVAMLAGLDITTARNYALLVLIALAPLGLELTLSVLMRLPHKQHSETVRTALGYAVEDAYTLLGIIALSLLGTIFLHIPAAVSALQLLLITCVVRPLLSGRSLQALPHKLDRTWRVIFAVLLAYGSFVFYFIRHYLEPRYADSINVLTWQATTVTVCSLIACQLVLQIFNPHTPRSLAYRAIGLVVLMAAIAYMPVLQDYFMTGSLDTADWVWVLLTGLVFGALILLRQHVALHSREEIIKLSR